VSVRKPGAELGTRREIKNLNSFKFMQQAIDYEIRWQIEQIEDGKKIQQATVLFDPDTGETRAMRTKEDAADYRYFPDPDLPPLHVAPSWVQSVKATMPELPRVMAQRFVSDYGLPEYDATTLTQSQAMGAYFEAAAKASGQPKLASNWVMGEISRRLNQDEKNIEHSPVSAPQLGALIARISDGTISGNAAKQVMDALWNDFNGVVTNSYEEALPALDALIEAKGLKQMNDSGALEKIIDEVLAANPDNVAQFRAGKEKAFNALVGQAMKASKGKANPQQVNDMLRSKLAG
jgi:aspartyl-tRNA(Asn)/glutamyl-tRNA(Gln) amidotransferase subunit B